MARSTLTWLRVVAAAAFAAQIVAQDNAKCYYPNGEPAAGSERPCSSAAGSACCPDKWQCLDNGLCYYPANNIYGTYSCTDKDWKSPGCPSNLCTYGPEKDKLRAGGESMTQCSTHNDDWCCNADNQNVHCCQESPAPRPFFQLQDGKAYATIGVNQASSAPVLSTITGLASGSGGSSPPSKTPSPSSAGGPSSGNAAAVSTQKSGTPTPVASVSYSLSSIPGGAVVSIPVTVTVTPTTGASTNNTSSGGSGSNLGVIIGCAVGIPLALALAGILIWLLRKRRNQKKSPYKGTPEMEGSPGSPAFAGGASAKLGKDVYRHSRPNTSEIDGAPIGATRPISNVPGHAELASGTGFQPGHGPAFAPDAVGLGGGMGDNRGSAPPRYSPGMAQTDFAHPTHAMELADTSIVPVTNEKERPQQYQAYRPPHQAAELPTVMTPPEDLEKQVQK